MSRKYTTAFMLTLALLAGCAPSKQEFAVIVETVQGSAKARQLAMKECTANWTPQQRKEASIVIDSSEKDAPRLVCSRFVEAIRAGRVDYNDAVDIRRKNWTPKLVRIFQGR
ncbi:hypothetical protein [Pararhizobium sp. A13]|uniref:hypothetical protein n=1 Tax=Pararhizobium sp. A13 TaxID=3133975 RepID=UPI00311ADA72